MDFNFILIAFASHGISPSGSVLHGSGKAHKFAPLATEGPIYTADTDLWAAVRGVIDERSESFCPQPSTIAGALKRAERENYYFLIALTQLREFELPGPSGNVHFPLQPWSQLTEEFSHIKLTDAGFDVVDEWGLSGLSNIGYDEENLAALESMQLQVNQFGLFEAQEDAEKFASFASTVAVEHAPFMPVRILVRIPSAKTM